MHSQHVHTTMHFTHTAKEYIYIQYSTNVLKKLKSEKEIFTPIDSKPVCYNSCVILYVIKYQL